MLEKITNVQDLKRLAVSDLPVLCAEIRQKLIDTVSQTGGHLASNLGAVELNVALHYVFDETDKIVWDVGHQSYVHKLLTGRNRSFDTLRQKGGVCGFPDCDENPADCFNVGHAGTAISAALGLAKARDLLGQTHKVVAVVGDGAFSCGMEYEALNNVGGQNNLLIILNDNNMSISDTVGTAALNLSRLRVGKYDKNKQRLKNFLLKIPLIGKPCYNLLRCIKRRAKLVHRRNSYFDTFDLKYIGIIDGNEIKDLVYYLRKIRQNVVKPTVLHIVTKKGKGLPSAEADPEKFHMMRAAGSKLPSNTMLASQIVSDTLLKIASCHKRIVAVCAAMDNAVGFRQFRDKFPQRFFDVGIAEEHAVTFAAGLAKGGMHPFLGMYSTFLQRSYDQILHDVALQRLPVTFLVDRAGFVGSDGQTHQGLFDLSFLSNIPNLCIWTPSTSAQLADMMEASVFRQCPVAIRYPREILISEVGFDGRWQVCGKGEVKVLTVGSRMYDVAMRAADGLPVQVVQVTTVRPLDEYLFTLQPTDRVLTLEENVLRGGFGESVAAFSANNNGFGVTNLGVKDKFVKHATVEEQLAENGLTVKNVKKTLCELLSKC